MRSGDEKKIHSGVLNTVGYMLLKEGKVNEAIKVFEENASAFPDDRFVFAYMGEAYATKGNKSISQQYYRKALEKDSLNVNAIEILRYLQ